MELWFTNAELLACSWADRTALETVAWAPAEAESEGTACSRAPARPMTADLDAKTARHAIARTLYADLETGAMRVGLCHGPRPKSALLHTGL